MGHLLATGIAEGPEGILVQENDLLHQACARRLLKHGTKDVNVQVPLGEINRLMAHQLGGMLQVGFHVLGTLMPLQSNAYSITLLHTRLYAF